MRYCSHCTEYVEPVEGMEGDLTCPHCGREVDPEEQPSPIRILDLDGSDSSEEDDPFNDPYYWGDVDDEEGSDEDSDGSTVVVHTAKKAKPALTLGTMGNQLWLQPCTFRFAFWNFENFSSVLTVGGPKRKPESLDTERNQVRVRFLAETMVALNLDALALMELGSDAEMAIAMVLKVLAEIDPTHGWDHTMSEFVGRVVAPPDQIQVALHPYTGWWGSVCSLLAILPYYDIVECKSGDALVNRHLEAHKSVARRSDRAPSQAVRGVLNKLEQAEGLTHKDIFNAFAQLKTEERHFDHILIIHFFAGDRDGAVKRLCDEGRWSVLSLCLVLCGAQVKLVKNKIAIETDGPRQALRMFGYNIGRYERYAILFRTGLSTCYLLNDLVMTKLMKEGEPTNSRAALSFNLPIGWSQFLSAFMIHSMYTPAPVGRKIGSAEGVQLRIETLLEQARHANTLDEGSRPMFIFGDTNIPKNKLQLAIDEMAKLGYRHLGDARPTSLRREGTIRSAYTSDQDFYCQPYDACYQRIDGVNRYSTQVLYPGCEVPELQDVFLRLLSQNGVVRNWFFQMLKNRFVAILRLSTGRHLGQTFPAGIIQGAISAAGLEVYRTDRIEMRTVGHTTDRGQRFLTLLFSTLNGAREALGIKAEDLYRAILDEEDDDENEGNDDEEEDVDDNPLDVQLNAQVCAYLALSPMLERAFAVFHRRFGSDHRLILMLINYLGVVVPQRVVKSDPQFFFKPLSQVIAEQNFTRGRASGRGYNCFLYSLLQLINATTVEDHGGVAALRLSLALDGVIPLRGFLDIANVQLGTWVAATYPAITLQVWARDAVSGDLVIRHTVGTGGTVVKMLLDGNHFEPLW